MPGSGSAGLVGVRFSSSMLSACKCSAVADGFHCGHFESSINQAGPFVQSEVDNMVLVVPQVKRLAGLSPVGH